MHETKVTGTKVTDHESMANMKTKFMALWDGFSTDPNARVMVLAATNRPSEFDEPILRRLSQAFEIGMPERKERAEILKVTLKGERVEPDIDYDHLAQKMETMSSKFHMKMSNAAAFTKFASVDVLDLEKVLATSKKTQVAAGEYCGLRWSREPDEVEAATLCIFFLFEESQRR
ncbi:unnamed protein product [Brassica rapa subsp. narinosa]